MQWINVNEDYLDYLRGFENRIPKTNYGDDRYKPFFGILFEKEKFYYITQVSHPKPKHRGMKNQKDFYKIYDPKMNTRLIAVVNLNYMFPILKNEVSLFEKSKIDIYRNFKSENEKSKYIDLLNSELAFINTLNLDVVAQDIYSIKYQYPDSHLAQRCLDFKKLEIIGEKFVK